MEEHTGQHDDHGADISPAESEAITEIHVVEHVEEHGLKEEVVAVEAEAAAAHEVAADIAEHIDGAHEEKVRADFLVGRALRH